MILDATSAALHTTLTGGTALTAKLSTVPNTSGTVPAIYDTEAVDHASYNYAVYSHAGGGPDLITPSNIESNLWFVRVYSATSMKSATEAYAQADLLLHKKQLSITGLTTFWCAREENVKLVETTPSGNKAYMAGGIYRVRTT
jgi:hypothetical protein